MQWLRWFVLRYRKSCKIFLLIVTKLLQVKQQIRFSKFGWRLVLQGISGELCRADKCNSCGDFSFYKAWTQVSLLPVGFKLLIFKIFGIFWVCGKIRIFPANSGVRFQAGLCASWICSTLTEFCFRYFVPVNKICSQSGINAVRKSAIPHTIANSYLPPHTFR